VTEREGDSLIRIAATSIIIFDPSGTTIVLLLLAAVAIVIVILIFTRPLSAHSSVDTRGGLLLVLVIVVVIVVIHFDLIVTTKALVWAIVTIKSSRIVTSRVIIAIKASCIVTTEVITAPVVVWAIGVRASCVITISASVIISLRIVTTSTSSTTSIRKRWTRLLGVVATSATVLELFALTIVAILSEIQEG
jgi:hypothetical protein